MLKPLQFLTATVALVALLLSQAQAQDDSELAKKTQNPVADLIDKTWRPGEIELVK